MDFYLKLAKEVDPHKIFLENNINEKSHDDGFQRNLFFKLGKKKMNYIKKIDIKDKPIVTMCKWITTYIMNICVALKNKLSKYIGNIMLKPIKRLDKEVKHSGKELVGIPCRHIISTICYKKDNLEDFINNFEHFFV
ncbi:hypothetical protein CR513_16814, partial [Mucuna pruriens]